jgi:hypothetical protein
MPPSRLSAEWPLGYFVIGSGVDKSIYDGTIDSCDQNEEYLGCQMSVVHLEWTFLMTRWPNDEMARRHVAPYFHQREGAPTFTDHQ